MKSHAVFYYDVTMRDLVWSSSGPPARGRELGSRGSPSGSCFWGTAGKGLDGGSGVGRRNATPFLVFDNDVCVVPDQVCYLRGLHNYCKE